MAEVKNLAQLLKSGEEERGDSRSDFIAALPISVKRRVKALKKLQIQTIKIESEFHERVHQLEVEFGSKFDILNDKRRAVVTGEHEPTNEEADYPLLHGLPPEHLRIIEQPGSQEDSGRIKGVPKFWLEVMKNASDIAEMIEPQDEPILEYLYDIVIEPTAIPPSFTLVFRFMPNPYFTNVELRKWYALQIEPDEKKCFDYDGPMIVGTKGTAIHWEEGKDVTKKCIKKKQRKGAGAGRFLTKVVKAESFFNFFDPPVPAPKIGGNETEVDDEEVDLLQADYEIASVFRDQIVPRAVLFYTGEVTTDEDYDEYESDNEESANERESDTE